MNKLKNKLVIKIIISLIFIILLSPIILSIAESNMTIIDKDGNVQELTPNKQVNVQFNNCPVGDNTNFKHQIIRQDNVFCNVRGNSFTSSTYKVKKIEECTDDILNYLLNQGKVKDSNGINLYHKVEPVQLALWHYKGQINLGTINNPSKSVYNSLQEREKEYYKSYVGNNNTVENWKNFCKEQTIAALEIYNAAINYKNNYSISNPTVDIKLDESNQKAIIKLGGYFKSGTLYVTYKDQDGKILLNKTITVEKNKSEYTIENINKCGTISVTLKAIKSKYGTKIALLSGKSSTSQEIIVVPPPKVQNIEQRCEATLKINPDVSMQKYIKDSNDSRKNMLRKANESVEAAKKDPSYNNKVDTDKKDKLSDIVNINEEDIVTYKIVIYNNRNFEVKNITLTDILPNNCKNTIKEVKYNGNTQSFTQTNGKINISGINIKAKNSAEITIKIQYTEREINTVITNTAKIDVENNIGNYRTEDSDYVYMKPKAGFGLEKFVSKVERKNKNGDYETVDIKTNGEVKLDKLYDLNGDGKIDQNDVDKVLKYTVGTASLTEGQIKALKKLNTNPADGNINTGTAVQLAKRIRCNLTGEPDDNERRYNYTLPNGDINKKDWKLYGYDGKDNKVEVEKGDRVTFTIRVWNYGEKPIKVTKIYDEYNCSDNEKVFLKGIGDVTLTNKKGIIDISDLIGNEIINPKEYLDFEIRIEVNKDGDKLYNLARIEEITDENENVLAIKTYDSDGTGNNQDMDFIKVKRYAVSLEKFVSKVNGEPNIQVNEEEVLKKEYDLNNDGIVDQKDAELILDIAVGNTTLKAILDKYGNNSANADINRDQTITTGDSVALLRKIRCNQEGADDPDNSNIVNERRYNNTLPNGDINKNDWKLYGYENDRKDNRVEVKKGDKVTFTIRVRNNGNFPIKVTKIYDEYNCSNNEKVFLKGIGDVTLKDKKGTIDISDLIGNEIINPKEYLDFEIRIEVDKDGDELYNLARIEEITDQDGNTLAIKTYDSDGTGNNQDMDFIKVKKYAVELEKYVEAIKSSSEEEWNYIREGSVKIYNPRAGKRYNNTLADGDINKNTYKLKNPVSVDVGQMVMFKIKLHNSGKNTVKITKIRDRSTCFKGTVQYKGNGQGDWCDISTVGIRSEIVFNNAKEIKPGETEYVYIQGIINNEFNDTYFGSSEDAKYANLGYNLAKITQMTDKNGNNLNIATYDSDGTDNNQDMDFLKLNEENGEIKKYAASLEKFISKIDDIAINTVPNVPEGKNSRADLRYNSEANGADGDENRNTWKLNNPVKIDKTNKTVTYTIRLKNTGNFNERIIKITDTFDLNKITPTSVEGNGYNKILLNVGKENGNITFNLEDTTYLDNIILSKSSKLQSSDTYYDLTIIFGEAIELEPGKTTDVHITFNINDNLLEGTTIENIAELEKIENTFGIVEDADGGDNNRDCDYFKIKEKIYSVSLEKFVSAVNGEKPNELPEIDKKYDVNKDGSINEDDIKLLEERKNNAGGKINFVYYSNMITALEKELKNNSRAGLRYNENSTDPKEKNTWKSKNPVKVEVGDTVTFTIRLANTGEQPVKVTTLTDTFTNNKNGVKLEYNGKYGVQGYGNKVELKDGKIEFENQPIIPVGGKVDITLQFKIEVPSYRTNEEQHLNNKSSIYKNIEDSTLKDPVAITDENGKKVKDNDGEDNNEDQDFLLTKTYAVSLEKYVSMVNNNSIQGRDGKPEYLDSSKYKYNNVVNVENGDEVTYTIKLKNDGNTNVKISKIIDTLPNNVTVNYRDIYFEGNIVQSVSVNDGKCEINIPDYLMAPGKIVTITMKVIVNEPNMSLNTLTNTAEIIQPLINKNSKEVLDTTPENNKDSDYIQLKDITISGFVWNDQAFNKDGLDYNGKWDDNITDNNGNIYKEDKLSGIKVYLYNGTGKNILAEATTDNDGAYRFIPTDKFNIKGPKAENSNRWAGTYNSYIVKFEYDGVMYTSTVYTEYTSTDATDSNAEENDDTRENFNKKFALINSEGAYNSEGEKTCELEYETINESGYLPQSKYKYNDTMRIQANTSVIDLSKVSDEIILTHINLGLRGRDIFDLNIYSNVSSTNVTVNGQQGSYVFNDNTNELKIRNAESLLKEDAANTLKETRNNSIILKNQNLRQVDIDGNGYSKGLEIKVTYKVTVENESKTAGIVNSIVNYYDKSKYSMIGAFYQGSESTTQLTTVDTKDYSTIIYMPNVELEQSDKISIYVEYKLNNAEELLKEVLNNKLANIKDDTTEVDLLQIKNLFEIHSYKTKCAKNQPEKLRGLIDCDSAPGSAKKEKARTEGEYNGTDTTVVYYFSNSDLQKLKLEDDTHGVIFNIKAVISKNTDNPEPDEDSPSRQITGFVFEDKTTTDEKTRIKTGNGKLDDGEKGIYGATVQLIEKTSNGDKVVGQIDTNEEGKYTFKDLLPGKYQIKYYYGNNTKTVLLKQSNNKEVNEKSYNGEDYQYTNNTGTYGAGKLNKTEGFWYVYNETDGISVATDDKDRRNKVSEYVMNFTDAKMESFSQMREKEFTVKGQEESKKLNNIIEETYMWATTDEFIVTVEKTVQLDNGELIQLNKFPSNSDEVYRNYIISNMNFGIAEAPLTKINLRKSVEEFIIKDSTGKNTLAGIRRGNGSTEWESIEGEVLVADDNIDVSIKDEDLQGAQLEVTYKININRIAEINWDGKESEIPIITSAVDFIDKNLTYDSNYSSSDGKYKNSDLWEVISKEAKNERIKEWHLGNPEDLKLKLNENYPVSASSYNTIVQAKEGNGLLLGADVDSGTTYITLGKVLTAPNSTLQDIVTSTIDIYTYNNTVEITGISAKKDDSSGTDTTKIKRDRIRTGDGKYIIIPGIQHDYAQAEVVSVHPPTGSNILNITYYLLAFVSLVILAGGVYGIKKFVLNK